MTRPPWENEDGSTNVDGWITAYAEDNNTFWRAEMGHIMNVVDELLDRLDQGPHPDDVVDDDGNPLGPDPISTTENVDSLDG